MNKTISFTKDEMTEFLSDYADALYEDNPPKSIFEDNRAYLIDYVNGYFEGYFGGDDKKDGAKIK